MVQDNGDLIYSGKVGIGTDAPTAQLDVLSSNTYGISSTGSTTGSTGLYHIANSNAPTSWNLGVEGGAWAGGALGSLYIDKEGVGPLVTFAPSGNVGIGTTNPIRAFHNGTGEMILGENQAGLADWKKWRISGENLDVPGYHRTQENGRDPCGKRSRVPGAHGEYQRYPLLNKYGGHFYVCLTAG
jgi:hypothetical protein